jgi:hypothetical protein
MKFDVRKFFALYVCLTGLLFADVGVAGGRFSQLMLSFPDERSFQMSTDEEKNTIVIHLDKTSPNELTALDHYDERLIRRVLVKDLGPLGSEIKLILKNRSVKATVNQFSEPFRIAIDLFDKDYKDEADPVTGLPIAEESNDGPVEESAPGTHKRQLLDSNTSDGDHENPAVTSPPSGSNSLPSKPITSDRRRLLQPTPDDVTEPGALERLIASAPEGRAKSWSEYPIYIYPIQTAAYEGRRNAAGWVKTEATTALSSAQAMAEYAFKLFSFGHEARALLAYQQVLYKDSSVFAKDALHLWALAEVHLGHGNLALTEGYYDTLMEKHPDSPLAKFAALRKLDVKAVRLLQGKRATELSDLLADLNKIGAGTSGELRSQIAIRKSYWSQQGIEGDGRGKYLPTISDDIQSALSLSQSNIEGQRTAFLSASIILKNMVRADRPWSESYGAFADQYFKNFRGPSSEPIYSDLKEQLHKRLSDHLVQLYETHHYAEAIHAYEVLPSPLKSVTKGSAVAWSLAESYRNQDQPSKSMPFYEQSLQMSEQGPRKFQSAFWVSTTAANLAEATDATRQLGQRENLQKKARAVDQEAKRAWTGLSEDDRLKIGTAYKVHLEKVVQSSLKLRTPAEIVLESWTKGLSSRMDGTNGTKENQWTQNFSPNSSSVYLLGILARKFGELGLSDKKREAIKIMQAIKPEEFASDKKAKEVWNRELLALADDYRKANNYMEAGRLYAFTAKNSGDVAGRAENLYKGGLMLYRSGQREEAVNAFTLASEDGNNLFYANLAKERLSQLKN